MPGYCWALIESLRGVGDISEEAAQPPLNASRMYYHERAWRHGE
jgi:hypothetical protein